MKQEKEKAGVSISDGWSTGHCDAHVVDAPRKPVLYTADGKPLGKNPQRIGFQR